MADFYADEDFVLPAVHALRALGHSVLTASEAGNANQGIADDVVLEFATARNLILITFNRKHFVALHGRRPVHSGIVVCKRDTDFARLARNIDKHVTAQSCTGKLIRISQNR